MNVVRNYYGGGNATSFFITKKFPPLNKKGPLGGPFGFAF